MNTFRNITLTACVSAAFVVFLPGTVYSLTDSERKSYDEVLVKCVREAQASILSQHFDVGTGVKIALTRTLTTPCVSWGPRPVPIDEFLDPNAVPFLIDVALNGPEWTDEKLLTNRVGILPHIARCIAVLTLGAHRDPRALEPLVELLKHGDYLEEKFTITSEVKSEYGIRPYAARALEFMQDPCAVAPLITIATDQHQSDELRFACLSALTFTCDMRILPVILEYWEGLGNSCQLDPRVSRMLKAAPDIKRMRHRKYTCKEFPELGIVDSTVLIWRAWFKVLDQRARQRFNKGYQKWKRWRSRHPEKLTAEEKSRHTRRLEGYGVASLPYFIDAVRSGDADIIDLVWPLTDGEVKRDATPQQVLSWWDKNKDRWTIPYEKLALAEEPNEPLPSDPNQ